MHPGPRSDRYRLSGGSVDESTSIATRLGPGEHDMVPAPVVPAAVLDTIEVAPIPPTMRPSATSETPKSPEVPAGRRDEPGTVVQDVPVPMPCVDRNQNSTEKLVVTLPGRHESLIPSSWTRCWSHRRSPRPTRGRTACVGAAAGALAVGGRGPLASPSRHQLTRLVVAATVAE